MYGAKAAVIAAIRPAPPRAAYAQACAYVARPGRHRDPSATLRVVGTPRGIGVKGCDEPVFRRGYPGMAHDVVRFPRHKHTRCGADGRNTPAERSDAPRHSAREVPEKGAGGVASGVDVQVIHLDLA